MIFRAKIPTLHIFYPQFLDRELIVPYGKWSFLNEPDFQIEYSGIPSADLLDTPEFQIRSKWVDPMDEENEEDEEKIKIWFLKFKNSEELKGEYILEDMQVFIPPAQIQEYKPELMKSLNLIYESAPIEELSRHYF